jgi:hypothetical protein
VGVGQSKFNSNLHNPESLSSNLFTWIFPSCENTGEIGGDITFEGCLRDFLIRSNPTPPCGFTREIGRPLHQEKFSQNYCSPPPTITLPPPPQPRDLDEPHPHLAVGYLGYILRDTFLSTVKKLYSHSLHPISRKILFDSLVRRSLLEIGTPEGGHFCDFISRIESIQVIPNSVDYIQPTAVTRETGT